MRRLFGLAAAGLAATLVASAAAAAAADYKVIDRIKGPDGGWDFVHLETSRNRLWMTRGTTVMSLDLKGGEVRSGLVKGQRLHDVLPVNGGREILVTAGDANEAFFADAETGEVKARIPTGKNPDATALDPVTGLVLVMDHDGGEVVLIDPEQHKAVGRIMVAESLEMAAVDGKGHAYVNVEDANETVELDLRARTIVRHIKLPGCKGPTGVAYLARQQWIIAACDGTTAVVDARSGKGVVTLKTGKEADGVAVDEQRGLAFVPGREGSLSVISLKGPKPAVVQVLRTEPNNRTLALDPRDGRVYLPVAALAATAPGARPSAVPGTFQVLVVGS
jgi:DNA-binding beta-propeller fold protein YncE